MMEKFNVSLWDKGFRQQHFSSFDHILLCKPDFPWERDEMRENPIDRDRLFEHYQTLLEEYALSFHSIGGLIEHRQDTLSSMM